MLSPKKSAENVRPKIADVEYIIIVRVVPILLMLCKKKNKDVPTPPNPRKRTLGRFEAVMMPASEVPERRIKAISTNPPIRDLRCTNRATSILLVAILLRLLSIAQKTIEARIRTIPWFLAFVPDSEAKSRFVVTIIAPA